MIKYLRPIALALSCAAALALSAGATAQEARYPTKPIKLINPGAPGGLSDLLGRVVADRLTVALGQPVVMDYKPGAGGLIAIQNAKGQTDGHTLMLAYTAYTQNLALRRNMPYAFGDFIPVSQIVATSTGLFVSSDLKVNTLAEFIALMKANPGKYAYGSTGIASTGDLMMKMLEKTAGFSMTHAPYKAEAPGVADLISGQIVAFPGGSMGTFLPHVKSGKLKLLTVAADKRIAAAPDAPTWAEAGFPAIGFQSWTGFVVPAGTPQPIVARLSDEISKIVRDPQVQKKFEEFGTQAVGSTAPQFAQFLEQDLKRWQNAARVTQLSLE